MKEDLWGHFYIMQRLVRYVQNCYIEVRGCGLINILRPSDAICRNKSGSILVEVMAWCSITPNHYKNKCWVLIREVLWHSFDSNFTAGAPTTVLYNEFENSIKITAAPHRVQWVKCFENATLTHLLGKSETICCCIKRNAIYHINNYMWCCRRIYIRCFIYLITHERGLMRVFLYRAADCEILCHIAILKQGDVGD